VISLLSSTATMVANNEGQQAPLPGDPNE